MDVDNYYFPVYKGLQKPLEFMGLRGRFITLAGVGIGCGFVGYIVAMLIFGQLVGIIFMAVVAVVSLVTLYVKQKQGLHSKNKCRDILIYHNIYKH